MFTSNETRGIRVAVIGGGLVGALEACLLAKRGFKVTIFENRHDGRNETNYYGRSINLAISYRGIRALKLLGLDHLVEELGIPMKSRMIHNLKGTQTAILYDPDGRCINSIERAALNNHLLNVAEQQYGVEIKFKHKLIDMDLKEGVLKFLLLEDAHQGQVLRSEKVDIIFGCDGARSTVRSLVSRVSQMDTSQTFIEHSYLELRIAPREGGEFKMAPNHLHIWPRGEFMMIALPNKDRSFTCTLFVPTKIIEGLRNEPEKALSFFERYFPDSVPLIGAESIKETVSSVRPSPLISIRCSTYHYGSRVVLLGDSAHAMVPFYGQGMNCGFEDCVVLDALMDQLSSSRIQESSQKNIEMINQNNNNNISMSTALESIFEQYSNSRVANGQAMSELAMYNYIEMRDLVNTWSFKMRKLLDSLLYGLFPSTWIPLYTMVTFTHIPIDECIRRRQRQDRLLMACKLFAFTVIATGGLAAVVSVLLPPATQSL